MMTTTPNATHTFKLQAVRIEALMPSPRGWDSRTGKICRACGASALNGMALPRCSCKKDGEFDQNGCGLASSSRACQLLTPDCAASA